MWMESFAVRPEVRVRQGLRLRKKNYYILRVPPSFASTKTLQQLSLFPKDKEFSAIDLKIQPASGPFCGALSWEEAPSTSLREITIWSF